MNPVVRRATAADAPVIEWLYRELVADPSIHVLPDQVAAMHASSSTLLFVVEVGGEVAGTALLTICADVMYGTQPFGVVENVIVSAKLRGAGIGRLLMEHLEQEALARDCSKLMLLSSAARQEAHAFFRRQGFSSDTKLGFVKYRRQFAQPAGS